MLKKSIIIISLFLIVIIRVCFLNIVNGEKYELELSNKVNRYVYGSSAPRGRILDRNGNVLVDNEGVKTLYYHKVKGITLEEEIEIAYQLAEILNVKVNENKLKDFWLLLNNNGDDLITEEEYKLYDERKLSSSDIKKLKYNRIDKDKLNELTPLDRECATIYALMNKGYTYDKKMLYEGLSDDEYSKIIDKNIKGVTLELTWKRKYLYGDTLKDLFGTVGYIPEEKKEEYLNKGYSLNDIIGLSYLELEYEDYLKGEKEVYKVNNDHTFTTIKEGKVGNDLVLSIDILAQLELEKIIEKNILQAKKYRYTDYFSESYSIVGDPNTGEIIALSGRKLVDEDEKVFKNINTNLINNSYTVGSIVKMATLSTGYKYGIVDIGTSYYDSCIKLYQVPMKCSYKSLGKVNDLSAISKSSNYYQFKIAIGLTGHNYKYNMKLDTTKNDFNKFRGVFSEYGLGVLTGIDLPNEKMGITGKLTSSDLLLNLSIGQYDTYTPMQLFQYVNTLASKGERRSPSLMKKILNKENILLENEYNILNQVDLEDKYLLRIKEAMKMATSSGTARNYINSLYEPAGKTGTSETFIDTNNDSVMDTKTTSIAFVGFAPYTNSKYSIVVLAPNLYVAKEEEFSKVYITRYISKDIMNFLFEKE